MDGKRRTHQLKKKLLVEAAIVEFLAEQGLRAEAMELEKAVGDLTLIAFYYLLRIGEYTIKGTRNKQSKQCNSSMRISLSSKEMPQNNCNAFHNQHQIVSSAWQMVLPLS